MTTEASELSVIHSLPDEHHLLRAVVNGVNDTVFVKDLQGRYLFMNDAGCRFLGRDASDVIGKTDAELFPESAGVMESSNRAVYASGRATKFEKTVEGPNGPRVFLSTKAPYRDAGGRLIGLLGIACDITERKRMEEELRRSHQETVDILESIADGFYTLDRQWRLTYINRRAEKFLKMSRTTDIGRSIWEMRPETIGSVFQQQYEKVLAENTPASFEAFYDDRWWDLNVYPKSDGISVYFRDITDRKLADLVRAESEARYALVSKATTDVIYDWDNRNDCVYFNEAIESQFFYSKEQVELNGRWWEQHIHPDERQAVVSSLWAAIAGDEVHWSNEYRFMKGDGTYADILDRAYIQRDATGAAIRTIGVMQDLTQRKRTQQLESEREHLTAAISAMECVLGVVGHELRTPLAGLMATCDYLLSPESAGQPEREKFLVAMSEEVVRMSNTVDDLLEAARLNSGRARWTWSEFEVESICRCAMDTIQPLIDAGQVKLQLHVTPAAKMRGDAAAVRRLLLNLLTNARKHTAHGSIQLHVSTRTHLAATWTEIVVRDTGEGIPPEILERLGEAFALNSGVVGSNHVSGTGLGLAICKGIAEAHGGSIRFESQPGNGAAVTVLLRADLQGPAPLQQRFFPCASNPPREAA